MTGLYNILWFFAYALAGSIAMAMAMTIFVAIWSRITPIDEWEELKKGNLAVAVVVAAAIIGFALVVSSAVHP
ncbi:MAG: DUF350 domain-containing protein [Verrucomicrobiaceae bacterium]|nr:DUF350 domain-containing protein [Verrucomicrobiaceae bacterium]